MSGVSTLYVNYSEMPFTLYPPTLLLLTPCDFTSGSADDPSQVRIVRQRVQNQRPGTSRSVQCLMQKCHPPIPPVIVSYLHPQCPPLLSCPPPWPGHWNGPLGAFFESFGAVKASPMAAFRLLRNNEKVLLFPGGAKEVVKKRGQEYQLLWKDTPDFVS